jgi:hypothetical protein
VRHRRDRLPGDAVRQPARAAGGGRWRPTATDQRHVPRPSGSPPGDLHLEGRRDGRPNHGPVHPRTAGRRLGRAAHLRLEQSAELLHHVLGLDWLQRLAFRVPRRGPLPGSGPRPACLPPVEAG